MERTQLRHRLRTISSVYSNRKDQRYNDLSPEQYHLLDEYVLILKQGGEHLPVTDKTQEYAEKILNLEGQIEVYKTAAFSNNNNMATHSESKTERLNGEREKELKEYFQNLVEQLQQQNAQNVQNNNNTQENMQVPQGRQT